MATANLRELDQRLAGELHRRKVANEMDSIKTKMAIENSEEIKHMRAMIQQAYLNKDRAAQISEKQTRSIIHQQEEAMIDKAMLDQREDELRVVAGQKAAKQQTLLNQKAILHDQMYEKKQKCDEAREAFLKEESAVDNIIKKIIDEDCAKQHKDAIKKAEAFQTMQDALAEKERIKMELKEKERLENIEYRKYLESLEQREYEFKLQKAELEAAKEKIYLQMKEMQERDLAERILMDNLREELYREEEEARARKKDADDLAKKANQKEQMRQAEILDRQMKEQRAAEERALEEEYKTTMLKKFAQDEKLEQMHQQKRRMKELEHKREVEKMWQERLRLYREEREKELQWEQNQLKKDDWLEEVIRQEKERLLQEHLPYIDGFLPKAMVKDENDMAYFGATKDFAKAKELGNRY